MTRSLFSTGLIGVSCGIFGVVYGYAALVEGRALVAFLFGIAGGANLSIGISNTIRGLRE